VEWGWKCERTVSLKEKHEFAVVLDLPAPLSVNRTRRIDYRSMPAVHEWKRQADALFLIQKRKLRINPTIRGPFEATITISSSSRIDLDNGVKLLIDAAREYGLVPDDRPQYLRKLTVEFGQTEHGARIKLRPFSS
jgi:Holliday junction resolvase RusA-like endonuclease